VTDDLICCIDVRWNFHDLWVEKTEADLDSQLRFAWALGVSVQSVDGRLIIANGEKKMPTYDFKCKQCGKKFTLTESYSDHDRHDEKCPKCGSEKVTQLISSVYAKTSKKS
jgi:putative FmdB family regulatory protein